MAFTRRAVLQFQDVYNYLCICDRDKDAARLPTGVVINRCSRRLYAAATPVLWVCGFNPFFVR
jgi:hypothetical protein